MSLPAGTVTFLFTEIEGSTRLWEQLGSAMEPVVARHDRLLRDVVEEHGGCVVKGLGDGAMAVFATADAGVRAAAEAQRRIHADDWSPAPVLRARMGLHSADAAPIGGAYHAGVNRAVRLAEAAHGGQVLVSPSTAALVAGAGVVLEPLGMHQLRDLSEAIEIHQLVAPGLERSFPEPRTLDAVDHNLPAQRTSFVGRNDELSEAAALLATGRLVTLTGLGGMGKTRLAMQLAASVAVDHQVVRLVELAGLGDDADVAGAVRALLPWPGPGRGATGADGLATAIGNRRLLVLFDNCEHLLGQVAHVVDTCLARCPSLTVLATSREPLGIPGEHVRPLGPLSIDGDDAVPGAAVALFVDRARAAGGGSRLTGDAMGHVRSICAQLDGIPLAVELAAARISHLGPAEIADRLRERLGLLASRDRTIAPRHRTLTAALDWSHDLLDAAEQALLRRMAVFAGPVTLDALDAVARAEHVESGQVLDIAAALIDRSLVIAEDHPDSTRYNLLETVRRYALARLVAAGEEQAGRTSHARWCSSLLEAAGEVTTLPRHDQAEVMAALHWAASARDPSALLLAGRAWQWWEVAGRPHDGCRLLEDVLDWSDSSPSLLRSAVLSGAAQLAFVAADLDTAAALHERNIAELEQIGESAQAARSRNGLGVVHLYSGHLDAAEKVIRHALEDFEAAGDVVGSAYARSSIALVAAVGSRFDEAIRELLESVRLLRSADRPRDAASALTNLGNIVQDRGDLIRAHRCYEGALQLHEEVGDRRGAALSLNNLSIVAQQRGDHDHAVEFAERALSTFEEIGDAPGAAAAVNNLANFAAEIGDHRLALERYRSAVERFRDLRDARGTATSLANLADLAARCGEARLAWRCAAEALAIGRSTPRAAADSACSTITAVAERCGLSLGLDRSLAALLAQGDDLTEALLDKLRFVDVPVFIEAPESASDCELTRRERQVAQLVARGRTNLEIANELFISERTVESHMNHIRTKLAIDSRTQLVRWALDHELA